MRSDPSTRTDLGLFAGVLVVLTGVGLAVVIASDATGGVWFAIGTSAPTLAAALLWLGRRRRRDRRPLAPGLLGAARWVGTAVVLGAAPAVVAVLVDVGVHGSTFDPTQPARIVDSAGGPLLALLAFLVTGPLAEEFGWRGFVQPRLRRFLSPVAASMLLGSVWAVWHLPLFAVAGTGQSAMGPARAVLYLLAFLPLSYLLWFVSERLRGGVAAAVLLHLAFNASQALLRTGDPVLTTAVGTATATVLAVVVHLGLRTRRSPETGMPGSRQPDDQHGTSPIVCPRPSPVIRTAGGTACDREN